MPSLLLNAVSSKTGGGLNDLVNTVPLLQARLAQEGWGVRTCVVRQGRQALADAWISDGDVRCIGSSRLGRALWEWTGVARQTRQSRPNVVFHFSNFIPRDLDVPQVTVLRSVAYFSDAYRTTQPGLYQKCRYAWGRRLSRKTIERAAAVYCISHTQRRCILERYGALGEKVEVAYPGVECPAHAIEWSEATRQQIADDLPESLRAKLAPALTGRPVIVNVANNYPQKNLGDLLRGVEILRRRVPDVLLVMTAGLTQPQAAVDERLRQEIGLARRLVEANALIDLGPVPKDHVWPLLALADVFAFPSSVESFGHPLLEAMAMQTPVVASNTPVHEEVCGDAALFHQVGSPEDLADRLADVLEGHVDRAALARRGLARTRQFTWENHVETLCGGILRAGGLQPRPATLPAGSSIEASSSEEYIVNRL